MELMDVESTMTREEKGQIASESRQAFFVSQMAYGFLKTISATSFASNITRQRLRLNRQDFFDACARLQDGALLHALRLLRQMMSRESN
jgi:hypothetical protein